MKASKKSALALVALALALLCWWLVRDRPATTEIARSESVPMTPAREPAKLTTDATAVGDRVPQTATDVSLNEQPKGPIVGVHGRCIDMNGMPVADARVELSELSWWEKESGKPRWIDSDEERTARAKPTRSTADGRFTISAELPAESPHGTVVSVVARKPDFCRGVVRKASEGRSEFDVGDIVLDPGTRAGGIVHDVVGAPCAGVKLYLWQVGRSRGGSAVGDETRSAAGGTFAFENAPVATCTLNVFADDLRQTKLDIDLSSGEPRTDIEVILPELHGMDSISGTVVDPDEHPVPNAWLQETTISGPAPRVHQSTACDEHGRFRIDGHADTVFELVAGDRNYQWCAVRTREIRSGMHDILLKLDGAHTFVLRVRDRSGAPIERFGYDRVASRSSEFIRKEVDSHPNGEVRLASDLALFYVRVFATGYHARELDALNPDQLPEVVDVVLDRACTLRGTVRSKDKGVDHAWVRLAESIVDDPHQSSAMGTPPAPESLTDAEGRFELTVGGTGTVKLRAQHLADMSPPSEPIIVQPGHDVDGLVIELKDVGSIEGTILRSDGSPGASLVVAALHAGEIVQSVRTEDSGKYRLPGLPPGRYDITLTLLKRALHFADTTVVRQGEPQRWTCQVEPSHSMRLDIHLLETARLHLAVDLPEPPRSMWRLELLTNTDGVAGTDIVDRSTQNRDAFDVEDLDPFTAELGIRCDLPSWPQFRMTRQSIGRGPHDIAFTVHAGRIEGVLASPFAASEQVSLAWHEGSFSAESSVLADAGGRFVFECAPPGECKIGSSARPNEARTVVVKSAETTQVDGL